MTELKECLHLSKETFMKGNPYILKPDQKNQSINQITQPHFLTAAWNFANILMALVVVVKVEWNCNSTAAAALTHVERGDGEEEWLVMVTQCDRDWLVGGRSQKTATAEAIYLVPLFNIWQRRRRLPACNWMSLVLGKRVVIYTASMHGLIYTHVKEHFAKTLNVNENHLSRPQPCTNMWQILRSNSHHKSSLGARTRMQVVKEALIWYARHCHRRGRSVGRSVAAEAAAAAAEAISDIDAKKEAKEKEKEEEMSPSLLIGKRIGIVSRRKRKIDDWPMRQTRPRGQFYNWMWKEFNSTI
jgi:hypothetical protein